MWTRIGRRVFIIIASLFFVFPACLQAEDISFEATVNSNKISLQDILELTLSVHGAKGEVSSIPIPSIDGFEVRYVGPSTRFMIVNGVTSNEHSFIYNLFPNKIGHFKIPSIQITIDGKTYSSNPIDIDVLSKSDVVSSSTDQAQEKSQEAIEDKVFMTAFIDQHKVYVGQKTPVKVKVYVKDLTLQLAAAPALKPNGFLTDSTWDMQKSKETINGVSYDTLIFESNIYPNQAGNLSVGPFKAVGQLLYRIRDNNDFISDFFSRQEARPITLSAQPVNLEIFDLPQENKPEGFTGAVGQYDFKASVGPATVKLGDPLTLKMTISGEGRLKGIEFPLLKNEQFKTYDPQVKEEEGSKTMEQVIIPTSEQVKEVPALMFSYFDPADNKYKTITQGPFPVNITPMAKTEEFKAFGFVDKSKTIPERSFQSKALIQSSKGLINQIITLIKDWRLWFVLMCCGVIWFAFIVWQRFENKLRNDQAFARRFMALELARKGMKQMEVYLKAQQKDEFYDELNKVLRNYLADKLHKPIGSLSLDSIDGELKKAAVEDKYLGILKEIFERCDHIRFAAASIDVATMNQDYQKLQESIFYLEKKLK